MEIIKGHVSKDHVHFFVSVPPTLSVSKIVQLIKGNSPRKLLFKDKNLNKQYWSQSIQKASKIISEKGLKLHVFGKLTAAMMIIANF